MLRVATILDRNSKSPSPLSRIKPRAWKIKRATFLSLTLGGSRIWIFRLFYPRLLLILFEGSWISSAALPRFSLLFSRSEWPVKEDPWDEVWVSRVQRERRGARLLASGAHHHLSAQGGKLTAGEPNNLQESAMKNWNSGPSCPKVDNSIHWINLYLVENIIGFPNTLDLFDE